MNQESNRELQRDLYGEPLADIAARITSAFELTQAKLAELVGVSAPMMSQLLSAQRVKIGNPATLGRLKALNDLTEAAPHLTRAELELRLTQIREAPGTLTATTPSVDLLGALARAAAPDELERLASLTTSPRLAELLRRAARSDG